MKYLYEEYDEKNREDETSQHIRMRIANKRWNTYMRTLGYRCIDKAMTRKEREWLFDNEKGSLERVSHRGKWHNSVVPFSHKGPHEQANNLSDEQSKKV